jgi:hypothetical protein
MTNKEAIVNHLVWIASDNEARPGDTAYAWAQAKRYAAMRPEWSDIPEILTQRMAAAKEAVK